LLVALAFDDFGEQSFLAAVFLPRFIELLLERGEFGLTGGDGIPLGTKITGDEQGGGNKVGLKAALAFLEIFLLGPDQFAFLIFDLPNLAGQGTCQPPGITDEVAIVLHGLGQVVHEVLIDDVGVKQRCGLEGGQQLFGDTFDERLGMARPGPGP
jgi:hypothetical protein